MARRWKGRLAGERWLGNTQKKEVHDLDNEKPECLIDEIIRTEHDVSFRTHVDAEEQGYSDCPFCVDLDKDDSCEIK